MTSLSRSLGLTDTADTTSRVRDELPQPHRADLSVLSVRPVRTIQQVVILVQKHSSTSLYSCAYMYV